MTVRPDLQPLRRLRPLVALPLTLRNRYLRRMAACADLFLAPSEFLRRQYVAQGFPADRILYLENGIETFPPQADDGRAWEALRRAPRPRFAFVGSLAPQKGVHLLVEAFNRLPQDETHTASLSIIGGDILFPEYARDLRAQARHPNLRFLGPLAPPAVRAALGHVDCLVVPSTWYENSPLVIQEAYAAGVPVLAARIGALEEKVRDGVTGRLFEAGSVDALAAALRDLIDAPEQLAALRAGVKPPPDIAAHAARLVEIYGRLTAAREPQAASAPVPVA
jgi:glycosyltransferase involved in cell wall biosynthesis